MGYDRYLNLDGIDWECLKLDQEELDVPEEYRLLVMYFNEHLGANEGVYEYVIDEADEITPGCVWLKTGYGKIGVYLIDKDIFACKFNVGSLELSVRRHLVEKDGQIESVTNAQETSISYFDSEEQYSFMFKGENVTIDDLGGEELDNICRALKIEPRQLLGMSYWDLLSLFSSYKKMDDRGRYYL